MPLSVQHLALPHDVGRGRGSGITVRSDREGARLLTLALAN
jgi:hypothetical protein